MEIPINILNTDKVLDFYYNNTINTEPAPKTQLVIQLTMLNETDVYNIIEHLAYNLLIIQESKNSGGARFNNYRITPAGRSIKESGGFSEMYLIEQKEISKTETLRLIKEEKDNLEMQKLRSENIKLVDELADYPLIKTQKRNAYIFAAISLLLTIISTWIAIAQYIKCK